MEEFYLLSIPAFYFGFKGLCYVIGYIKVKLSNRDYTKRRRSISIRDVPYYRDIPCKGDMYRFYYLAKVYGLVKRDTDFLGALLLKWLNDMTIKPYINGKGYIAGFDFSKDIVCENYLEKNIYDSFKESTGPNYILTLKLFKKWNRKYGGIIFSYLELIMEDLDNMYNLSDFIVNEVVSDNLHKEAMEIIGLKKFLVEFSRIDDRLPADIKLWNEYLIYGQILGIADKVDRDFRILYPNNYIDYMNVGIDYLEVSNYVDNFSNNLYGLYIFNAHKSDNIDSTREKIGSYDSGGGGFSSGGGGGGSFGGGSGGGTR